MANSLFQVPTDVVPQTGGNGSVEALATHILHILTLLAYPLAFVAIVYTAYLLITSAGNTEAYAKARKNITYLIIGIFLIVFSVLMVNLFVGLIYTP